MKLHEYTKAKGVVGCGGVNLADSTKCWSYNGSTWLSLPDSKQNHCAFDAPNLVVDQGWWVTGRVRCITVKVPN